MNKKINPLKDYSTTLFNKNYYLKNMDKLSLRMIAEKNNGNIWSVLFCDIDGLKLANETLGHIEADKGIHHIAKIIKKSIRTKRKQKDRIVYPNDDNEYDKNIPIRFGGDEFIVILPNCPKENAKIISNRIKDKIKTEVEKTKGMSLSIGLASNNEIEIANVLNKKEKTNIFITELINLAESRMCDDKNKNIKTLNNEDKEKFILKHLLRIFEQIGLDINKTKDIDVIIDILNDIKKRTK